MEDLPVNVKSGVYRVAVCGIVLVVAPPVVVGGGAAGQPAKEVEVGALYPETIGPGGRFHHQQVEELRPPRVRVHWVAGLMPPPPYPTLPGGGNRERAAAIHSALKGGGRPAGACAAGVAGMAAGGAAAGPMVRAAR